MTNSRIDILKGMAAQDPTNAFARYGLAMEYVKTDQFEHAMTEFRALLEVNPNYSAAYFHGGQTLEKMGLADDAKALYRSGIEATILNGDGHTRSELQAALDMLG